jgi:hypoxanthine phosphoribosyltransferase
VNELKRLYSPQQLAEKVASMGRAISKDYRDRTVDVVVILDSAFVFAADLLRELSCRVVCHFVHADTRDTLLGGHERREVYFSKAPRLENRDVLVVDAIIQSGLTQDFLLRRLQESRPRSLRLAVLFDKPAERRVDIKPDYFGFSAASKYLAGYGLAGSRGWYRNLPYVGVQPARARAISRGAARRIGKASEIKR